MVSRTRLWRSWFIKKTVRRISSSNARIPGSPPESTMVAIKIEIDQCAKVFQAGRKGFRRGQLILTAFNGLPVAPPSSGCRQSADPESRLPRGHTRRVPLQSMTLRKESPNSIKFAPRPAGENKRQPLELPFGLPLDWGKGKSVAG